MSEMTKKQREAKEILETFLKKIDWSLEHMGCNHYYVVNHRGVRTKWCLWDSHLSYDRDKYEADDELFCVCFEIKAEHMRILDGDSLSIGPFEKKYPFILFMNHDRKKQKRDALHADDVNVALDAKEVYRDE